MHSLSSRSRSSAAASRAFARGSCTCGTRSSVFGLRARGARDSSRRGRARRHVDPKPAGRPILVDAEARRRSGRGPRPARGRGTCAASTRAVGRRRRGHPWAILGEALLYAGRVRTRRSHCSSDRSPRRHRPFATARRMLTRPSRSHPTTTAEPTGRPGGSAVGSLSSRALRARWGLSYALDALAWTCLAHGRWQEAYGSPDTGGSGPAPVRRGRPEHPRLHACEPRGSRRRAARRRPAARTPRKTALTHATTASGSRDVVRRVHAAVLDPGCSRCPRVVRQAIRDVERQAANPSRTAATPSASRPRQALVRLDRGARLQELCRGAGRQGAPAASGSGWPTGGAPAPSPLPGPPARTTDTRRTSKTRSAFTRASTTTSSSLGPPAATAAASPCAGRQSRRARHLARRSSCSTSGRPALVGPRRQELRRAARLSGAGVVAGGGAHRRSCRSRRRSRQGKRTKDPRGLFLSPDGGYHLTTSTGSSASVQCAAQAGLVIRVFATEPPTAVSAA